MSDLDFQPHSFTFDICWSDMTSIFMTASGMRGIYSSRDEYKVGGLVVGGGYRANKVTVTVHERDRKNRNVQAVQGDKCTDGTGRQMYRRYRETNQNTENHTIAFIFSWANDCVWSAVRASRLRNVINPYPANVEKMVSS